MTRRHFLFAAISLIGVAATTGVIARMPVRSGPATPAAFVVSLAPDFEVNGEGTQIDSPAFWEAPDPADTRLFVTAKSNQLVEVWKYPFVAGELPALTHATFGPGSTHVNGIAVDQASDRLYIAVGEPQSTVSVFALPGLAFQFDFIQNAQTLKGEPNLALFKDAASETTRAYVSADNVVYIHDAATGAAIGQFKPKKGLETIAADNHYQRLYIPDENSRTGVYAYNPDGSPHPIGASNMFGAGVFDSDEEGILLFTCPLDRADDDDGTGFIVVSDQKADLNDYEFFDRVTGMHLGTLNIPGVSKTDGIASTQRPLPAYPLGLFVAVDDDKRMVGIGWDRILAATGLGCGAAVPTPPQTETPHATATRTPVSSPSTSTAVPATGTSVVETTPTAETPTAGPTPATATGTPTAGPTPFTWTGTPTAEPPLSRLSLPRVLRGVRGR